MAETAKNRKTEKKGEQKMSDIISSSNYNADLANAQSTYLQQEMGGYYSDASSSLTSGKTLDKNDFLKLLMAELKYQDPMSPMSNTDFVAQTAQFTALEQMQNLNQGFDSLASELRSSLTEKSSTGMLQSNIGLLNKTVTAVTDDENLVKGKVKAMMYDPSQNDLLLTIVGDNSTKQVYLNQVGIIEED